MKKFFASSLMAVSMLGLTAMMAGCCSTSACGSDCDKACCEKSADKACPADCSKPCCAKK